MRLLGCNGIAQLFFLLILLQPIRSAPVSRPVNDLVHQLNAAYEATYQVVAPSVVILDVTKPSKPGAGNHPFNGFDLFDHGQEGEESSEQPEQSEGSGVIMRSDGYILTNNHVISGAEKIRIRLKDGRSFPAKIVGTDDRTDLAVVKIDVTGLPTVTFADSDQVQVGELVCAIGTPYKFDYTLTNGIVSAKDRDDLLADKYEDYIQTDAAINPGNSGGPLCDLDGQVIGINSLIHGLDRGLAFAISSNLAKRIADQLIRTGIVIRPWLGIMIETLDDRNRGEIFKGVDQGVIVQTIRADTPAAKSDLRPADVILQIDKVPVDSARALQKEILKKKIGQLVELQIWRNGKKLSISLKASELPNDNSATNLKQSTPDNDLAAVYGFRVETTSRMKQEQSTESGVTVTQIASGSPAALAGLELGDVITEVGRTPVATVSGFQKILKTQRNQSTLLLLLNRKGVKTYSIIKTGQ
jgi:serine protease Do